MKNLWVPPALAACFYMTGCESKQESQTGSSDSGHETPQTKTTVAETAADKPEFKGEIEKELQLHNSQLDEDPAILGHLLSMARM